MRYIECTVRNEFVSGAGQVAGAAGSHHDVSLRLTFGPMWDGLNKYVTFRDALGENPTVEMILPTMLVEGTTYDVVVPAAAKAKQGKMMVTVSGFIVVDGVEEATATMTTTAYFTVLPSDYAVLDDESIDATLAEQLEAEINAIGTGIEEALEAAEDAEAWAVGQIDGVDVPNTDPRYENNSKYYSEQSAGSATASASSAGEAEAWANGGSEGTPSATNNAKYYSEQAAGEVENSEAWASGTRGGTPVTSDDPAYHNNSKYYSEQAADQVTLAEAQVTAATEKATLSESWAVGGTNTRTGEDTNNAKYWSEVAQQAAGGGVTSFNGRTGSVTPQDGDYTAAMVGARADDWTPSAADVGAAAASDIAPAEESPATAAHAVNDFIMYGGALYRVTSPIAINDALTVGTNIAEADAGTYLAMVATANQNGGLTPCLTSDVTYYVDSDVGLDTNDGTEAHPFKTVQHAIDILPKNLNGHRVNILLEPDGKTYDNSVTISGFYGGFFPIARGNGGASIVIDNNYSSQTPVTISPIFGAINVTNCAISVSLWTPKVTNGITVEGCSEFNTGFTSEGNSAYGLFIRCCPYAKVDGWNISNKTTAAIIVADSNVFLNGYGMQGSNNAVGLRVANNQAQSGFVNAAYSLPQGTTTLQKTNAAVVFLNGVLQ